MTRNLLAATLSFCLLAYAAPARAQSVPSNPAMTYGFAPSVGVWNSWFQQKQDVLGFTPLNQAGGTMLGPLLTTPSTTSAAGLNIGLGSAPSTPNSGDVWATLSGLYIRIGATTIGPFAATGANVFTAAQTIDLNLAGPPTPDSGALLHVLAGDGSVSRIEATSSAASSIFTGRRANGTVTAPSALMNADLITAFNAHGFDGASWSPLAAGAYRIYSEGDWSNGSHPTQACVSTTPFGSTAMADNFCVHNDGGATLGSATDKGAGTINAPANGYYVNGAAALGNISTLGANSLLANWTGSTAAPVSNAMPSCPDSAGNHLNFVSGSGITCGSTSSATAAVPAPQGRLTLSSGNPVMTSAVSASPNVYYAPYNGNAIPIWNGATFVAMNFTQLTNVLANSSLGNAGPAAAVGASLYDLFVWNSVSGPALTRGPAWTNPTTRSAGGAIARVNGIYVNSAAIANGPAGGYGTYVGTINTDGSGAAVSYSSSASGNGVGMSVQLWNMYNRLPTTFTIIDTGGPYTYSGSGMRVARNFGNFLNILAGVTEDSLTATYTAGTGAPAVSGAYSTTCLNYIVTSACPTGIGNLFQTQTIAAVAQLAGSTTRFQELLGLNPVQALESADGANTWTFDKYSSNRLEVQYPM